MKKKRKPARYAVIDPSGKIAVKELSGLEDMQRVVGGMIEYVPLRGTSHCGYVNAYGIDKKLPLNPRATLIWREVNKIGEGFNGALFGTMLICRQDQFGNDRHVSEKFLKQIEAVEMRAFDYDPQPRMEMIVVPNKVDRRTGC